MSEPPGECTFGLGDVIGHPYWMAWVVESMFSNTFWNGAHCRLTALELVDVACAEMHPMLPFFAICNLK